MNTTQAIDKRTIPYCKKCVYKKTCAYRTGDFDWCLSHNLKNKKELNEQERE